MNKTLELSHHLFSCTYTSLQKKQNQDIMILLCEQVQTKEENALVLLTCEEDLQTVGTAFAYVTMYLKSENEEIKSTSARNSYYCFSKAYLVYQNAVGLPTLLSLLSSQNPYFLEIFLRYSCTLIEQEAGKSIVSALGENPYQMKEFRAQIYDYIDFVKYYVASLFYDLRKNQYKIPTNTTPLLPSFSLIQSIASLSKKQPEKWVLRLGKEYFFGVYNQCEQTLKR